MFGFCAWRARCSVWSTCVPEQLQCSSRLKSYVRGTRPKRFGARPWWEANMIVCNLPDHWITCRIRFDAWCIVVLDSIFHLYTEEFKETRGRQLLPLCSIIPILGGIGKIWPWELVLWNCPSRKHKHDDSISCGPCGPFAVQYFWVQYQNSLYEIIICNIDKATIRGIKVRWNLSTWHAEINGNSIYI